MSERRALQERVTHQAFHDPLTNLANRALLKDRIEHALVRRIQQRQSSMAVLFVDLDDFKTINDSLGHAIGDLLLIAVADRMRKCLRPADTLARLGGDEFGILLEDMQHSGDAILIAARINEALQGPFTLSGKQVFVRASIGLVTDLSPDAATDEVLRDADTAMYVAKSQVRGATRSSSLTCRRGSGSIWS